MRLASLLKAGMALAVIAAGAGYLLTMPPALDTQALAAGTPADLKNGETIFNVGGCASCHATPAQQDNKRLGGGLAMHTDFGTFHVPNISPDPQHGIGRWSEAEFVRAMTKGIGRNGEHLYPAFPYTSYQRMALKDVRDLFAFLKTLAPDATPSKPHALAFPFNLRRGLGLWQLLFLDGKTFTPDPTKSAELNRGAYLVNGPGHCAECHSPRNLMGAIEDDHRFAGGRNPDGKGWIPNITPSKDGIADWTEKDIAYMLESGFTPEYDAVGSSMADVVKNTSRLSAADRAAMAAYLKSLPPRAGTKPKSAAKAKEKSTDKK
jgi:mono/diheme cytochrome c family protein